MVILPPTTHSHTHTHTHSFSSLYSLWGFELSNTGHAGQKVRLAPAPVSRLLFYLLRPVKKDEDDECRPVIISSILFHHVLHHCAYVFHCGTVYWSPIGRPLIAWRLSRKQEKKSKQRNSFVNSLLLLAADLAQVVMPILLERTQTSYCHPSLAGAPWTRVCACV